MAMPKKKISKARRNSRKANWKVSAPSISECPECHEMKLNHRACKKCGFYNGKKVIEIAEAK